MGVRGQTPKVTPGVAFVEGADIENVLDAQQGAGTTGAPIRFRGQELIKFKIIIKLWLPEHFDAWETFRVMLQTPPFGKLPSPLTVSHPWLTMQNVSQAQVKGVSQPVLDENMLTTITVTMWQYKQPRVTYSTLKSTPDAPLSPIDQKLKAARETLEHQRDLLA